MARRYEDECLLLFEKKIDTQFLGLVHKKYYEKLYTLDDKEEGVKIT